MAETWSFGEDNGTATGSPAKGTTRSGIGNSNFLIDINFKAADDADYSGGGTAYTSAPLVVSSGGSTIYSMPHNIYGVIGGTFTTISNCKFYHSSGTAGTGITLAGKVTSTYTTPAQSAISGSSDMTTAVSSSSGIAVSFSTTDPSAASPTSTLSASGFTQYLVVQMAVAGTASSGDTSSFVFSVSYDVV